MEHNGARSTQPCLGSRFKIYYLPITFCVSPKITVEKYLLNGLRWYRKVYYWEIIEETLRITPPASRKPPACKPYPRSDNRSCWIGDLSHQLTAKSTFASKTDEAVRGGHEAKQANNFHDDNCRISRPLRGWLFLCVNLKLRKHGIHIFGSK